MLKIPFVKYHGAGNDFVLIDLRQSNRLLDFATFARRVCERRWGIGADGLLLVLPSSIADCRMRVFNADGSEPSMCGNGIRCVADFLLKQEGDELKIETLHAVLKCRKVAHEIAVHFGTPSIVHWPIELPEGLAYVVNTGVPHAVLFVDDLDILDVASLGCKIRSDPSFAPHGANVNFAHINAEKKIALRTYERGIEGETAACGTGAAAVAYVAFKQFHLLSPISLLTRSTFVSEKIPYRQQLRCLFSASSSGDTEIEMLGPAVAVFEGTISNHICDDNKG
jgi:diaminopimelate epimerase